MKLNVQRTFIDLNDTHDDDDDDDAQRKIPFTQFIYDLSTFFILL